MDCDNCKACERVRDINGAIGSMDCDKTLDKVRWSAKIITVQGWALERYRILMDMLMADKSGPRIDYINKEREKVKAALKEQWDKSQ